MILNWILAEAWPYIAGAGAAALALLFAFMRGRSSAEQDQRDEDREAEEKAREIQNEIASEDDAAIRDRADAWVRGDKR